MTELTEGTYAIYNLQTGAYTPTPLGECKPSEVDLHEHEEIRVWDGSEWVQPDPEPTEWEKSMMNIRAFLDAIHDELERLEGMQ